MLYTFSASEKVADPSSWPLDFKRNEEKLSEILKAAAPFDKKQKEILEIIKARRAVAAAKIENYAKVGLLQKLVVIGVDKLLGKTVSTLSFVPKPIKYIFDPKYDA